MQLLQKKPSESFSWCSYWWWAMKCTILLISWEHAGRVGNLRKWCFSFPPFTMPWAMSFAFLVRLCMVEVVQEVSKWMPNFTLLGGVSLRSDDMKPPHLTAMPHCVESYQLVTEHLDHYVAENFLCRSCAGNFVFYQLSIYWSAVCLLLLAWGTLL